MKPTSTLIILISILFASCGLIDDDKLHTRVKQNDEEDWNKLVFFTGMDTICGYDLETMELKTIVKTNHLMEAIYIHDGKMIIGDQGTWKESGGGNIFVLDHDFSVYKTFDALPDIYQFIQGKDFLFAKSMGLYYGSGGMTVINLSDLSLSEYFLKVPGIQNNRGRNCFYNDKFYIGIDYWIEDEEPQNSVTVLNADLSVMETTNMYMNDFPYETYPEVIIVNNQMWVNYYENTIIDVFDLDTNEKLARINLSDLTGITTTKKTFVCRHVLLEDKYFIGFQCGPENYLLEIDMNSYKLLRIYELPVSIVSMIEDFKYFPSQPNHIYFSDETSVYKYSLETGEVVVKKDFPEIIYRH